MPRVVQVLLASIVLLSPSLAEAQRREIRDPAEYNAYIAAVEARSASDKISLLERFLKEYPTSVMQEDATELLMKTYQQSGDRPRTVDTGQRLLRINPNNLTSLALLTFINRAEAQAGGESAAGSLREAAEFAKRGKDALPLTFKPLGLSEDDWARFKQQAELIFDGALGEAALQRKDYPAAQIHFGRVVRGSPNSFVDVYQLSLSYLEPGSPTSEGLFWIARAVILAQQQAPQALAQITRYARSKYIRYHGSEEGFEYLLETAKRFSTVPEGFRLDTAPLAAEQVATEDSEANAHTPAPAPPNTIPNRPSRPMKPSDVFAKASQSLVLIVTRDGSGTEVGLGSGFFVRPSVIATNWHVIKGAASGYAKLAGSGQRWEISGVVGLSRTQDLVLLRILGSYNAVLPLGDSSLVRPGDKVYALGNPEGLEGTISEGLVSGVRQIDGEKLIQIGAAISHGSSGGPVLNESGQVIGVAVGFFSEGQNLNFAVPSEEIKKLVAQIRQSLPLRDSGWLRD